MVKVMRMKQQLAQGGTFQWFALSPPGEGFGFPVGGLEFLNSVMCSVGRAEGSEDKEHKTAQAVRRESCCWVNSESPWAKRVWQYLGTFRVKVSNGQAPRDLLFTGNVGNPFLPDFSAVSVRMLHPGPCWGLNCPGGFVARFY